LPQGSLAPADVSACVSGPSRAAVHCAMAARWRLLVSAAATVTLVASIAVGASVQGSGRDESLRLPKDNDRTKFRQPSAWGEVWSSPGMGPILLDGTVPTIKRHSDMMLHSHDPLDSSAKSWVDELFPFQWEREFNGALGPKASRMVWWVGYAASAGYLVLLRLGTFAMTNKKPFHLTKLLALWNLLLAVFSFFGMVRTVPHLLGLLYTYGFDYTVCRNAASMYGYGAAGVWVAAFIFSKYFELIDTVFLVLRKKPVNFLHWFHHCSVLLYCWHAYMWETSTGIYFVAMNYTVHTIMYFYYFLAAVCAKPPKWALCVTLLQLSQMAGGIWVTVAHLQHLRHGTMENCDGYMPNLMAALGMYASYFALFFQFLCKRFCGFGARNGAAKSNGKAGQNGAKANGKSADDAASKKDD